MSDQSGVLCDLQKVSERRRQTGRDTVVKKVEISKNQKTGGKCNVTNRNKSSGIYTSGSEWRVTQFKRLQREKSSFVFLSKG